MIKNLHTHKKRHNEKKAVRVLSEPSWESQLKQPFGCLSPEREDGRI